MLRPTGTEPVKKMWSKRKPAISGGTTSLPMPCTTATWSFANASAMMRPSTSAVCGTSSLGFTTAQLPAATAPTSGAKASSTG